MAGYTVKDFDTIVADIVAWIVAHSGMVTDVTPGSVLRSLCEGAALCLEEIYVGGYLGFKRYLETLPQDIFEFTKKDGTKATTIVVFSRTGTSGTKTIPAGTRVGNVAGLNFVTDASSTINAGSSSSANVAGTAEEVGVAYNVSSGALSVMTDSIDGVETVTNANAATGGTDDESDFAWKQRFQAYFEGLGRSNGAGCIAGALSYPGITSASYRECFPPESNVNAYLYIDDGSQAGVSAATVAAVQEVIDGDGTEDNPGYRALGVNVVVDAPTIVTQDIDMSIKILAGAELTQIEADINQVVTNYVNVLGVGKDMVLAKVIAAVMAVYGVTDCVMTLPLANVVIAKAQVCRVGTITVSVV